MKQIKMKQIKVEICFGTTCHVMGGEQLLEIESNLPKEILPYIDLIGIGCVELCKEKNFGKAPFVRVDSEIFDSMTVEKLTEILTEKYNELK